MKTNERIIKWKVPSYIPEKMFTDINVGTDKILTDDHNLAK